MHWGSQGCGTAPPHSLGGPRGHVSCSAQQGTANPVHGLVWNRHVLLYPKQHPGPCGIQAVPPADAADARPSLCGTEGEDGLQALPCKIPAACNARHDCKSCLGQREFKSVFSASKGPVDSSLSCPPLAHGRIVPPESGPDPLWLCLHPAPLMLEDKGANQNDFCSAKRNPCAHPRS